MTDKLHTDLGTKEIHKRHAVMVEGGTMPRAKVMDQNVIDRYLMDGLLTLGEHQAGEYILSQAVKAGIFSKPLRYEAGSGDANPDSMASDALMRYGKTLRLVGRRYGDYARYLVEEVVVHGWDISASKERLLTLKKGLGWIAERRMSGGKNPVRHLKSGG
ncbi:MAG: hypothetical protein CMB36_04375 [Euryarchaeota archaeon]|nr:hypothetical protein [Euryarchaeota archaeon]|tara:strand:- start:56 stop:535 length:480 start_codon:yes stop_codon:yes gene_type:complete